MRSLENQHRRLRNVRDRVTNVPSPNESVRRLWNKSFEEAFCFSRLQREGERDREGEKLSPLTLRASGKARLEDGVCFISRASPAMNAAARPTAGGELGEEGESLKLALSRDWIDTLMNEKDLRPVSIVARKGK